MVTSDHCGIEMSIRLRKRRNRRAAETRASLIKRSKCSKCGEPGMHFVPPSLGEPGFYACDAEKRQVAREYAAMLDGTESFEEMTLWWAELREALKRGQD